MASVIAKQDIHWDRIPVDGNSMRFQFRCLLQSSEDCTSWQNPMSFKRHMERMHNMKPEATRRGRPPTKNKNGKVISPTKTNDGKRRICSESLTDRSSGNYPYKWWIRKKYQLGLVVRKIVKQMQLLNGIQEESKIIHKALEYYGRWRDSEKAIAIQKKLAESTRVYWMDKGLNREEAGVKGKIPLHLQQEGNMKNARVERSREPEPDVVYMDGGYKIIRRNPTDTEEHEEGDAESDEALYGKDTSEVVGITENGFTSEDAGEEKAAGQEEECKEDDAGVGEETCDKEKIFEADDACGKEKTYEKEDAGEGNNAYEDLDITGAEEEMTRVENTYVVLTVVCIQRHSHFLSLHCETSAAYGVS